MSPPAGQRSDEHAQFLIAVGDLCSAAERAGLDVDVETDDGAHIAGVPSGVRACGNASEAVDETGYARCYSVGGAPVELDAVVACTVRAPG